MISLNMLDLVLLIILFFFAFSGFFFGFIKTVGKLMGIFLGFIVAINYFHVVASWIGNPFGISEQWMKIIVFILLFLLVDRLVNFIFYLLKKVFSLPFLKGIDRIVGLVFSLLIGIFLTGVLFNLFLNASFGFFGVQEKVSEIVDESRIAKFVKKTGESLTPKLPEYFDQMKDYAEKKLNEYTNEEFKDQVKKYAENNDIEIDQTILDEVNLEDVSEKWQGLSFSELQEKNDPEFLKEINFQVKIGK
jgi:membrane protein required for colicin V production